MNEKLFQEFVSKYELPNHNLGEKNVKNDDLLMESFVVTFR